MRTDVICSAGNTWRESRKADSLLRDKVNETMAYENLLSGNMDNYTFRILIIHISAIGIAGRIRAVVKVQ